MFRVIVNSSTADAADTNDNFYWVAQGSIFPLGGTGLDYTTASDLGSATYRWRNLRCNTMVAASFNPSVNMRYITSVILSADTSRFDISGLNGQYNLYINYYLNTQTTGTSVYMIINGNSSSIYGYEVASRQTSTALSLTASSATSTAILISQNDVPTSSAFLTWGILKCNFDSRAGQRPKLHGYANANSGGDYNGRVQYQYGIVHTNTSLTSITLYSTGGDMKAGTYITVWSL